MGDAFWVADDIENIILTGEITRKFNYDARGTRYEVLGHTQPSIHPSIPSPITNHQFY